MTDSKITIGLAVYNGGPTLEAVICALLAQTHSDFILMISDNASSDETPDICRKFAATDSRIDYRRQTQNVGAEANFAYLLAEAKTEYFMWAAADDLRSNDFLELNLAFLEANPDYVGSTSPVAFEGEEFDSRRIGDATRDEDAPAIRVVGFFGTWHANGRYYSLFRRRALAASFPKNARFFGADWLVVLNLLALGKLKRLETGWVRLGKSGVSNSLRIFRVYRSRPLNFLFPFFELTLAAFRLIREDGNLNLRAMLAWRLAKLNAQAAITQLRFEYLLWRGKGR